LIQERAVEEMPNHADRKTSLNSLFSVFYTPEFCNYFVVAKTGFLPRECLSIAGD